MSISGKLYFLLIFCILGSIDFLFPQSMRDGVLDLTNWNPQSENPLKLEGEWEFYWGELFDEDHLSLNPENRKLMKVPANWTQGEIVKSQIKKETSISGKGYATYRAQIILSEKVALSIRTTPLGTAYNIYIDEKLLHNSGLVGKSVDTSYGDKGVYYKEFFPEKKSFYITVVVSNFQEKNGGFRTAFLLGSPEKIRTIRDKNLSSDLFISGILFIMGIYHISLFLLIRKDKTPLFFGIFCILITLRTLLTGENYLYNLISKLNYHTGLKLEYLTLYLGTPIFIYYILLLYPDNIIKKIILLKQLIYGFLSSIVIFFSPNIYTETLSTMQLLLSLSILIIFISIIEAVLKKKEGAKSFFVGFSVFSCVVINDILHNNHIINTGYFSSFGLVVFIFSQTYLLTSRFTNAFMRAEDLSRNLENKVVERTFSLEKEIHKSNTLNQMIEVVIQSKSTDEIFFNIYKILSKNYKLSSYLVYILDPEDFYLKLHRVYGFATLDHNFQEIVLNNHFHLNDSNSVHASVVRNKKSILIKKIKLPHACKGEEEILYHANVKSFYTIPLIVDDQSFGCISFSSSKYEYMNIKEINNEQRAEIENLIKLISPSIYQSLQKSFVEKAKQTAEYALQKANKLNEMVEVIINSKSYREVLENIYELLNKNYQLDSYILFIYNEKTKRLSYFQEIGKYKFPEAIIEIFKKNEFLEEDENSVHLMCMKRKKSFFSRRIKFPHPCKKEEENMMALGVKSVYIIPLIVDEEVIGTIDFSDNSFETSGLSEIKNESRHEIEDFMRLISPSIGQAYQKTLIENAYTELKQAQVKLIEAEKMSALGNLVGSISHEINNPISVVRSNSNLLHSNINFLVNDYPIFLESLSLDEKKIFGSIVEKSIIRKESLSSREERIKKREIEKEIKEIQNLEGNYQSISEDIIFLGIEDSYKEYLKKVEISKFKVILGAASNFSKQIGLLKSIEIAVDKASRVVFSLRSYLNMEISSNRKSVNLSDELRRVVQIHENYIIGKIKIEMHISDNIHYECTSENLFQVWNNLIFNSIQSMYDTEKNLHVSLLKSSNLPEDINNYKSSNPNFKFNDNSNYIVARIRDSGVGIPNENQEKIFTPFFTTKRLGEGIGLGLFVSRKVVHEHGGVIYFQSQNRTTEFIVILPE